jgi:hypothetical protein
VDRAVAARLIVTPEPVQVGRRPALRFLIGQTIEHRLPGRLEPSAAIEDRHADPPFHQRHGRGNRRRPRAYDAVHTGASGLRAYALPASRQIPPAAHTTAATA